MLLLLPPILPSLPKLSPIAIVDILVVAFLIYQLLMIVRGTRAGHIMMGILTMVAIYSLAVWLGLEALRSLLSYIVPYTAIAVIILFQSEIRRTLARIGRKRWFGRGFKRPESIDEDPAGARKAFAAESRRAHRAGARYRLANLRGERRTAGCRDFRRPSNGRLSSPAARCMMARSSCRRTALAPRRVSCR